MLGTQRQLEILIIDQIDLLQGTGGKRLRFVDWLMVAINWQNESQHGGKREINQLN